MRKSWSSSKKFKQWWHDIKERIVNFDIRPAKPIIHELVAQADQAFDAGDVQLGEKLLFKAFARNHTNVEVLYRLYELHLYTERFKASERFLRYAIRQAPQDASLHERLGFLYIKLGKKNAAAAAFRKVLSLDPQNCNAQHLLDANAGKNTEIAPRQYVENLFNVYSEEFEDHLTALRYQTPDKLAQYINKFVSSTEPINKVIDLGCGTGWIGEALKKTLCIQQIIGVDLSSKMLEQSKAKNIYDVLHQDDVVEFLRSYTEDVDLITSCDVLVYIGDLNEIFAQSYRVLKPGGFFAFSTEKLVFGDFKLSTSGRYKHSLRYLKSLYKQHQFSKMYSLTVDLRLEYGTMIPGYLVLLQK